MGKGGSDGVIAVMGLKWGGLLGRAWATTEAAVEFVPCVLGASRRGAVGVKAASWIAWLRGGTSLLMGHLSEACAS